MPSREIDLVVGWLSPAPALAGTVAARDRAAVDAALGREHLVAARGACDQRLRSVAAELYGGAMERFATARVVASAEATADSNAEPRGEVDAAALIAAAGASGEAASDAAAVIGDPKRMASLDEPRARKALAVLDRVTRDLERGTYPLSDAEVSRSTFRRRAVVAAAVLLGVGLGVRALVTPRNLARGKPVTASSVRFGTPQGLVNGSIEWGTFGLHTGGSGREWATIDLLDFHSLESAEIYSRGDGRFEFNLPLRVELSDDGSTFRPGGACSELFTQSIPCVVDLHRERARYVRVTAPEVVLAEVEVYGR